MDAWTLHWLEASGPPDAQAWVNVCAQDILALALEQGVVVGN